MIVALLLAACPTLSLPPDATFTAFVQSLQRENDAARVQKIEAYVTTHALLAAQALQVLSFAGTLGARQNVAATIFPAIVDKDTIVPSAIDQRITIPKWYLAQPDRFDVEHARLLVGPFAQITGALLPPVLCIAISPADDRVVTDTLRAMATQQLASDKVRVVYAALRDRSFTARQAKALIDAIPYDAEKLEAGRVLRNRVVDRPTWNELVCKPRSEWFDCALD